MFGEQVFVMHVLRQYCVTKVTGVVTSVTMFALDKTLLSVIQYRYNLRKGKA